MARVILGVNSAYHEPAACVLVDGQLVAMAEEERFNRMRHGKPALLDNSDQLPEAAIAWCLEQAGVSWRDIVSIGYSLDPDLRLQLNRDRGRHGPVTPGSWGTEEGERVFHEHNLKARDALVARAPQADFNFLPHHLCHAASAYLCSPFDQAAVLIADGIGEFASTWLGLGSGSSLAELESVPFPHSIGFVWEKMSELLGFDVYSGPGKLMGYACITDPHGELSGADHLATMREIFRPEPGGAFVVDNDAFRLSSDDFTGLERRFGPRRTQVVDRYEDASIAAALQEVTSEVLVHLAERLYEMVNRDRDRPIRDLCLAGGVALNCVANYEIAARSPFLRLWIQPAANDAGTALGAALLLEAGLGGGERPRLDHAYHGPGFSDDEMRRALEGAGLAFTSPDSVAAAAARRIERGEIVAWFQGRQEVGPRALGNRSILCDPSRFDTRTRINLRVKYRESFRPFAPSVLPEGVERFFSTPAEILGNRYMLAALPLRERRLAQVIPAVVQENGSTGVATSRIHEVDERHNPLYAEVIREFAGLTGLPLVLNTSFNIREPILTTPDEAIATFMRSSMDAMVLGPYLVLPSGVMLTRPISVEWIPARVEDEPGHRLMVLLAAPGCAWAKASGGCSNCSFPQSFGTGSPVSAEELRAQLAEALENLPEDVAGPVEVDLFVSGSFLNPQEIPPEAQVELVRQAAAAPGAERILVESRPEYVTAERLRALREAALPCSLELGIGLESASHEILGKRIRKGFTWRDYEHAVRRLAEAEVDLLTYVLLKPLDTPEREAVDDAVATAERVLALGRELGLATRIALEPCFVAPHTEVAEAFAAGRYRPPWLWSAVEVVGRVAPMGQIQVGLSDEGLDPAAAAHNCRQCSPAVRAALARFNLEQDAEPLGRLHCGCRQEWQRECGRG